MNLKGVIVVKIYANTVFIFFKKNLLKDAFLRNPKFLELTKFIGIFDDVHLTTVLWLLWPFSKNRLKIYWAVLKIKSPKEKSWI